MATRNVTKKKMAAIAPTTYLAESIEWSIPRYLLHQSSEESHM
jgi:hypothetical protein